MTKEQLYVKWLMTPDLKSDIEAVIAKEIAKVWELELVQGIPQPVETKQPAKPFDKERFEAMFRAVYQSTTSNFDKCIEYTKENLNKLDAYYAEKEKGGNNG